MADDHDFDAEIAAWEAAAAAKAAENKSFFPKVSGWKTSTDSGRNCELEEDSHEEAGDSTSDDSEETKTKSLHHRAPSLTTRSRVVLELINTESAFVRAMESLVNTFYIPLKNAYLEPDPDVLSIPEISKIVRKLEPCEAMLGLNQKLLSDLESQGMYGDVAIVFAKFAPFLKMYHAYMDQVEDVSHIVTEAVEKKPNVMIRYTKRLIQPIQSLLIKPVQRIPQYKLLFTELLKETSENSDMRAGLENALAMVDQAASHCDRSICKKQQSAESRNVVKKFDGVLPENINRRLLKQQKLNKTDRKGKQSMKTIYLFSDCVGYRHLRSVRALDRVFMFADGVKVHRQKATRFCIESTKKSFMLQAKSTDCELWIKAVTEALEEFKRRQALKIAAAGGEEPKAVVAPVWSPDTKDCNICGLFFGLTRRRHHCRRCGVCVCNACSPYRWFFPEMSEKLQRVCCNCYDLLRMEVAGPQDKPKPPPPPRGRVRSDDVTKSDKPKVIRSDKPKLGIFRRNINRKESKTKKTKKEAAMERLQAGKITVNEYMRIIKSPSSGNPAEDDDASATSQQPPVLPTASKPPVPQLGHKPGTPAALQRSRTRARTDSPTPSVLLMSPGEAKARAQQALAAVKAANKDKPARPARRTKMMKVKVKSPKMKSNIRKKPKTKKKPPPPKTKARKKPPPPKTKAKKKPPPPPPVRHTTYAPTAIVRRAARRSAERQQLTQEIQEYTQED